jgi:fatty acid desaturase
MSTTDTAATTSTSTFSELLAEVKHAGLMDTKPGYYAWKVPLNLALLAAGWVAFFVIGDSWWQLLVAVYLGIFYVQTGLVGHDIGHRQIARSRGWAEALGYFHGNLLLGFSYGWWVGHHSRHHNNPNHLLKDPDIARRRVIFTVEQGDKPMSDVRRFIIRHQSVLFFPLLLLESLGLRIVSVRVLRQRAVGRVGLEGVLIGLHLLTYFVVVFSVLGIPLVLAFIVIHQGTFGIYTGSIFAPNHKGLPVRTDEESLDWLTRQVITSRNIRSGRIIDFLYGGLNYQIEHHLFPTMPRLNLRKARPMVMRYCREREISYHETSLAGAYAEIVRHLAKVSTQYRQRHATRSVAR